MILAIDTATQQAGLALFDPDTETVRAEHVWYSHVNHTVELAPNLHAMLATQKLSPSDLTGIAVARGPGSFTGLRIGMSIAKALAYAQGIDVVAIPTPDIVAHAHAERDLPLWAILHAGRGRVVATRYAVGEPSPGEAGYRLTTLDKLADEIRERALFSGEIDAVGAALLHARLGDRAVMAPPALRLRRPACLAELGWARLQAGDVDDLVTLVPIYLHRPEG